MVPETDPAAAGPEGRTLRLQRTVKSTAEQAYAAFVKPTQLSRWFTTAARADVRVGGRYSNADGDEGEFTLLDARRLVLGARLVPRLPGDGEADLPRGVARRAGPRDLSRTALPRTRIWTPPARDFASPERTDGSWV